MTFAWLTLLFTIRFLFQQSLASEASSDVSFLASDGRAVYKALLYEGPSSFDMRWWSISNGNNGDVFLSDFDFDATRRRLVFAVTDPKSRTVSVSECYLLRPPNEDHLSCSLTTSLLYRQIVEQPSNPAFLALDWLNGDVYILLPQMFVHCPLPIAKGKTPECVESPLNSSIRPNIIRIDPFTRSMFWNQIVETPSFCAGINRISLTSATSDSACLHHDATVSSILVNFSTSSIVFTNASTPIYALDFQEPGFPVKVVRNLTDGHFGCPMPVRSLMHIGKTDVFFWHHQPMSQIVYEVDGQCSTHPLSKAVSKFILFPQQPRIDDRFAKSTFTEQVRCHCLPSDNFSLEVQCQWLYKADANEEDEKLFFVVEIGGQLNYRTTATNFSTVITQQQLLNELKMTDAITLHIAIRACSVWHCALPTNVYVKQSPFRAGNIRAYRAFSNSLPSVSVSIRWKLPKLFLPWTSVTITPEAVREPFFHQNSDGDEVVFNDFMESPRYLAKVERCNIWNCSEAEKLNFRPLDLVFEPLELCWNYSFSTLNSPLALVTDGGFTLRKEFSKAITSFGPVSSAVYLLSVSGSANGSIIWLDQRWRVLFTSSTGETRLLVEAPSSRCRRKSLAIDYIASRLYWIEHDTATNSAELHSVQLVAHPSQLMIASSHFSHPLSDSQSSTRIVVNSTSGTLFVISSKANWPSGATVFDLSSNKVATNIGTLATLAIGKAENNFGAMCRTIFDDNILSLYENRVCFDLSKTQLATVSASTPSSLSIIIANATNDFCKASSALRRLALQSGTAYLLSAADGADFGACLRRERSCVEKSFSLENGTAVFSSLPSFTDFFAYIKVTIPLFNQSRLWQLGRFKTQVSAPSEPRNFRCQKTTPEEITLEWLKPLVLNGPGNQIEYSINWHEPSEQNEEKLVPKSMIAEGTEAVTITHLKPQRLYEFRLVSRSRLFPKDVTSQPVFARCETASIGQFIVLPIALERSKLSFRFTPSQISSTPDTLTAAYLAYGPMSELRFCSPAVTAAENRSAKRALLCSDANCTHSGDVVKEIFELQPKTFYRFCLVLNYSSSIFYVYPKYSNIVVETGGFKLEPPKISPTSFGIDVTFSNMQRPLIANNNQIEFFLIFSNEQTFCDGNSTGFTTRNVTSFKRSLTLPKSDFSIGSTYWFRLKMVVGSHDQTEWLSECSDGTVVHSLGGSTAMATTVNSSSLMAASGLIALVSCLSVIAFCLCLFAIVFLIRRVHPRVTSAKMLIGRYFCRLLDYSGLSSNNVRSRYRFDVSFNDRTRSIASGLPIYSSAAATAANGRAGLWSLSTSGAYMSSASPGTITSSAGGGCGAGSVFSFDTDLVTAAAANFKHPAFPMRFLTLANQIYATPAGLSNWLMHLPPSVLRLSRDQIVISRFLGAGAFGEVYEGEMTLPDMTSLGGSVTTRVAVKTLKPDADGDRRASFCREAALMSHFHHPNIVRLIGMCVSPSPHSLSTNNPLSTWPLMVLELMNGGDLLGYLRRARSGTEKTLFAGPTSTIRKTEVETTTTTTTTGEIVTEKLPCLTMADLIDICVDVAAGCRYLEKSRFCHRDIAARNCLVTCPISGPNASERRRVVKIGDFGLARTLDCSAECYKKVGEGLMPVRWMSPESLNDGLFTTQSDVWSFGVLMFEVFSLGRQPYAGRANQEVFEMVKAGSHPECPRDCPTAVCRLMLNCFQQLPENRPSFKQILHDLKEIRNATNANQHQLETAKPLPPKRPNNFSATLRPYSRPAGKAIATSTLKAKCHASMRMSSCQRESPYQFRLIGNNGGDNAALRRVSSSSAIATLVPLPDTTIASVSCIEALKQSSSNKKTTSTGCNNNKTAVTADRPPKPVPITPVSPKYNDCFENIETVFI